MYGSSPGVTTTAQAKGEGEPAEGEGERAESVTVTSSAPLYAGETITVSAMSTDPLDLFFMWWSSDEAVATVADGVVTGVKPVTAFISAIGGNSGLAGQVTITVLVPS